MMFLITGTDYFLINNKITQIIRQTFSNTQTPPPIKFFNLLDVNIVNVMMYIKTNIENNKPKIIVINNFFYTTNQKINPNYVLKQKFLEIFKNFLLKENLNNDLLIFISPYEVNKHIAITQLILSKIQAVPYVAQLNNDIDKCNFINDVFKKNHYQPPAGIVEKIMHKLPNDCSIIKSELQKLLLYSEFIHNNDLSLINDYILESSTLLTLLLINNKPALMKCYIALLQHHSEQVIFSSLVKCLKLIKFVVYFLNKQSLDSIFKMINVTFTDQQIFQKNINYLQK